VVIASSGKPTPSDADLLKQLLQGSGGASTGAGRVYMGMSYAGAGDSPHGGSGSVAPDRGCDLWTSTAEATQDYYNWTQKRQQDFVSKGILSGMLKLGDGPMEGAALWKKLVKEAANYGASNKKVTPFDIMASYVDASGGANAWTSAGVWQINTQTGQRKYVGPGTYLGDGKASQTDTRVDLTDPDTARSVATSLFQNMMGRDPGAGELSSFANALHTAEANAPVVSTTTTQYDMETGQPLGSDTTQTGGVTAEGKQYIGEQQLKKSKEYGAYQAATTYQNALDALVFGGPA
jgi:hypothetical protein